MDNYENEIKEWEKLLNSGEIDEEFYKKEVAKILSKKDSNFKKNKSKLDNNINALSSEEKKEIFIKRAKIVLTIICLIFIFSYIPMNISKKSSHPLAHSNIPDPIQKKTSGSTTVKIDDQVAHIDFLYSYSISGRVVSTYNFVLDNFFDKLSPRDIGMTWGVLSTNTNNSKLSFKYIKPRVLSCEQIGDFSQITQYDSSYVDTHISNNHLIPKSEAVLEDINKIKKNDFIKIEGYLVTVTDSSGNKWKSSITRGDSGYKYPSPNLAEGSCEIIYVTSVTWL